MRVDTTAAQRIRLGWGLRASASFLTLTLAAALSHPAAAQQADEQGVTMLDTIVIYGTKRDDRAQDIPTPITVLGQEQLSLIPPTGSNADIARSTPNFSFVDYSAQYSNVGIIRGVGSFSPLSAEDTSVVFNVDEIPRSAYGMPVTMLDMQQIEVLRGPQGTLFGRNAQGGAVNFITNAPTFEREFMLRGEVGTNGHRLGEFIANGALIDDVLAGRLAVQYTGRDGDVPNIVTGGKEGAFDVGAARGSLLFTPSADTTAQLTFHYNKSEDNSSRFLLRDYPDFPVSGTNPENKFERENYGVNLRFEHAFENFRFTSVSSIQQDVLDQRMDLTDGLIFGTVTGLPSSYFDTAGVDLMTYNMRDRTYFQEFRLSSLEDSPVSWVAGLNYYRSEFSGQQNGDSFSIPSYAIFSGAQDNDLITNSYSAFGEATVPLADRLKATFGLRATHETKDITYRFTGNGTPGTLPSYTQHATLDDTFLTGRAALSYNWTDDLMTYVSVGRGAVAGGMPWTSTGAALGADMPSYPTSTSWTYEAGFKSTLLDGRMMLNGSVFFNDVKNGHLLVVDPATYAFSTAALDYETYGAELEARIEVTPGLNLFGGVGYTHAELKNIPAGSLTGASSGNTVPNVPQWTANIGAEYRFAATDVGLSNGEFFATAVYQFVGERQADVGNRFALDSYGIVNAKIGWEGENASVYAFGTNLFDERYEAVGNYYGPTALTVRPGPGRVVGIGATVKF